MLGIVLINSVRMFLGLSENRGANIYFSYQGFPLDKNTVAANCRHIKKIDIESLKETVEMSLQFDTPYLEEVKGIILFYLESRLK